MVKREKKPSELLYNFSAFKENFPIDNLYMICRIAHWRAASISYRETYYNHTLLSHD